MNNEKSSWGGARDGAGRKATMNGNTKMVSFRITVEAAEKLSKVANKSAFINQLINENL